MSYRMHTVESAPEAARETLAAAQKNFGFVPNLLGVMAEAPALLKGYLALARLFLEETSFTPTERQLVALTASRENGCEYCVAAHSVLAARHKVPDDVTRAIRGDRPVGDKKLEALHRFTTAVVNTRGWPSQRDVQGFLAAGYGQGQILEVILGVGFKTLSNYTNHMAHTPLDEAFAPAAWRKTAATTETEVG